MEICTRWKGRRNCPPPYVHLCVVCTLYNVHFFTFFAYSLQANKAIGFCPENNNTFVHSFVLPSEKG